MNGGESRTSILGGLNTSRHNYSWGGGDVNVGHRLALKSRLKRLWCTWHNVGSLWDSSGCRSRLSQWADGSIDSLDTINGFGNNGARSNLDGGGTLLSRA